MTARPLGNAGLGAAVRRPGFSRNPAPFRLKPGLGIVGLLWVFLLSLLGAAEVLPTAPKNHFNDFARLVRPATASQLNRELEEFERTTSNQIVVAIYPRLESQSSVEDYAVRVAQSWRVGQKDRKNGAVLFFFQESHDIRIVTGYGLEGVLPDALCKRIIENEIVRRFRAGDFDGGVTAGVHALLAASKGEYRGTGRTTRDNPNEILGIDSRLFIILGVAFTILWSLFQQVRRRSAIYDSRGREIVRDNGSSWGGRGGWGGGGSSGGGGGDSFSGGGGSFGGGGAGGKW